MSRARIFLSYCHQDAGVLAELKARLSAEVDLVAWADTDLVAGDDWAAEIARRIEDAHLFVALVTERFARSHFCVDLELAKAVRERGGRDIELLLVRVDDTGWTGLPFGTVQVVPAPPAPPVATNPDREGAWRPVLAAVERAARARVGPVVDLDLAQFRLDRLEAHLRRQHREWWERYEPLWVEPTLRGADGGPVPVIQALRDHDRLVLVGGAGSGKSTTLAYATQAFLHGALPAEPGASCLLVPLARFRAVGAPIEALHALFAEVLYLAGATEQLVEPRRVGPLLDKRPLLLLLDGLNEVPGDARRACLHGIADLGARHPRCRVVVTTRPGEPIAAALPGWTRLDVRPLDEDQARSLAERLGGTLDGLDDELRTVPLFLRMSCALAARGDSQPAPRGPTALVAAYADALLGWNPDALPDGEPEEPRLARALEAIAELLHDAGQQVAEARIVEALGGAPDTPAVLAALTRRTILVRTDEYLRFQHHTLQESWRARALARRWRAERRRLHRPPAWLRATLARPEDRDANVHLVARLDDAEVAALLPDVRRRELALALRWADELEASGRGGVLGGFWADVGWQVSRSAAFSRVADVHPFLVGLGCGALVLCAGLLASALLSAFGGAIAWMLVVVVGVMLLGEIVPSLDPSGDALIGLLMLPYLWLLLGLPLLALAATWALHRPSRDVLALPGVIPLLRAGTVRREVELLLIRCVVHPLQAPLVAGLCRRAYEARGAFDPVGAMRRSDQPFVDLYACAYSEDAAALTFLHAVSVIPGAAGLVALDALLARWIERPSERDAITEPLRRREGSTSGEERRALRRLVNRADRSVAGTWLTRFGLLCLLFLLGNAGWVGFVGLCLELTDVGLPTWAAFVAPSVLIPPIVYLDARYLQSGRLLAPGTGASTLPPWAWALLSIFPALGPTAWLWYRPAAKRLAAPIPWDALDRAWREANGAEERTAEAS